MTRRLAAPLLLAACANAETLRLRAEWRQFEAGVAVVESSPGTARLTMQTAGLARKLFPVDDAYAVSYDARGCAESSQMKIAEGRSRAETRIVYGPRMKVRIEDQRLSKEQTREFAGAACTDDVLGALAKLRARRAEPGVSVDFPIANERKFATVRVEAQERERIRVGQTDVASIRHEVHMLNDILYRRKGRLFLWLSDDAARLPLRIRVQMPFYLGSVTLELENRP